MMGNFRRRMFRCAKCRMQRRTLQIDHRLWLQLLNRNSIALIVVVQLDEMK